VPEQCREKAISNKGDDSSIESFMPRKDAVKVAQNINKNTASVNEMTTMEKDQKVEEVKEVIDTPKKEEIKEQTI
jgi:hypothetical protein